MALCQVPRLGLTIQEGREVKGLKLVAEEATLKVSSFHGTCLEHAGAIFSITPSRYVIAALTVDDRMG